MENVGQYLSIRKTLTEKEHVSDQSTIRKIVSSVSVYKWGDPYTICISNYVYLHGFSELKV